MIQASSIRLKFLSSKRHVFAECRTSFVKLCAAVLVVVLIPLVVARPYCGKKHGQPALQRTAAVAPEPLLSEAQPGTARSKARSGASLNVKGRVRSGPRHWAAPDRGSRPLSARPDSEAGVANEIARHVDDVNTRLNGVIRQENRSSAETHAVFRQTARRLIPKTKRRIEQALARLNAAPRALPSTGPQTKQTAHLALAMLDTLSSKLDYEVPSAKCTQAAREPFALDPADCVLDCYWMFYHYTEILGAFNHDVEYADLYAPTGRASFIESEVGRAEIETFMDWWMVSNGVWGDETLTPEQKLMSAKYTLWQNPSWGGGAHYVNDYWSWEPGFKDEDCALFTGNLMAVLAAEYSMTRKDRTFRRLRALVDAILHFDALTVDGPHPLDTGPLDGRIQRGPKTKNYYPEDDPKVFDAVWDGEAWHFHNNTRFPDRVTGRERGNVSRDQYYGVLTGYYSVYHFLSHMESLTAAEAQLLGDVIAHCGLIVDYLTGPRIRPGYGIEFNLYSLFEGSCANPPNLSFIGMAAFKGLEEMTGRRIWSSLVGYPLLRAVLDLGILLESVQLVNELLEPGQTGLTTLNQYLAALLMSDLPRRHWEFLYPPEVVRTQTPKVRKMWRRIIGAYVLKFGDFGNADYRAVIEELLDPAENPPVNVAMLFNRNQGAYSVIEPMYKVEEIMWPLMFAAAAAQNAPEIGRRLNERYQALIDTGDMTFANTDVAP